MLRLLVFFSCNIQSVDLEDICFPEMYIHRLCLLYTYVGRMSKFSEFYRLIFFIKCIKYKWWREDMSKYKLGGGRIRTHAGNGCYA